MKFKLFVLSLVIVNILIITNVSAWTLWEDCSDMSDWSGTYVHNASDDTCIIDNAGGQDDYAYSQQPTTVYGSGYEWLVKVEYFESGTYRSCLMGTESTSTGTGYTVNGFFHSFKNGMSILNQNFIGYNHQQANRGEWVYERIRYNTSSGQYQYRRWPITTEESEVFTDWNTWNFTETVAHGGNQAEGSNYFRVRCWSDNPSRVKLDEIWYQAQANTYFPEVADPPEDTLNISDTLPFNNSNLTDSSLNFNLTVNSSFGFTCDTYINDSVVNTTAKSAGTSVEVNMSYDVNVVEQAYNYYIACYNTSGVDEISENSSVKNFYVDSDVPNIYNDGFASQQFERGKTINANSTCMDGNLFAMNFSIYNSSHQVDDNMIQDINETTYSWIEAYSTTNWNEGTYYANITCWDDHHKGSSEFTTITAKDIDYVINRKDRYIIFGNAIMLKDETQYKLKDYALVENGDSLLFDFSYDTQELEKEYEFRLMCNNIYYRPNSQYEAHFVCFDEGMGIDFVMDNIATYEIDRIDQNTYFVKIHSEGEPQFKSIFGLNVVTELFEFNVTIPTYNETWFDFSHTERYCFNFTTGHICMDSGGWIE